VKHALARAKYGIAASGGRMPTTLPLDPAQRERVRRVLRDDAPIAVLESAAELHYAARSWNWDRGVAELRALVDRDDCALATALLLFWNSLPDEIIGLYKTRAQAEKAEGEGAVHDLQTRIVKRVAAGAFGGHDIGYDPHDHGGVDLTEDWDPDEAVTALPPAMFAAVPGRLADPDIRF
jgi:hypothetical protein